MEEKLFVIHTVNSGLYFRNQDQGILVDVLHGYITGFSAMPEGLLRQIEDGGGDFSARNDVVVTHRHTDHFDAGLVREFQEKNPDARIYTPEYSTENAMLERPSQGIEIMRWGRFRITAFCSTHDGAGLAGQPHRVLLLQSAGQTHLICGDAILDEELLKKVRSIFVGEPDSVFANVYQLSIRSRPFQQQLCARHIFVNHLPFPEDDVSGYWKTAERMVRRLPAGWQEKTELLRPGQKIILA